MSNAILRHFIHLYDSLSFFFICGFLSEQPPLYKICKGQCSLSLCTIALDPVARSFYIIYYIYIPLSAARGLSVSFYLLLHVLVFIFFSMNTQLHTEGDRWRVTRTIDTRPLQQDVYWSSCKIRIYERRACFTHFICLFDYFYVNVLCFFICSDV